jgi:hypothetical protein
MVCRLYRAACRKWGPRIDGRRVTVSAWAWAVAVETGDHSLRIRIDGLFMLLKGQQGHCQQQYQIDTRRWQ